MIGRAMAAVRAVALLGIAVPLLLAMSVTLLPAMSITLLPAAARADPTEDAPAAEQVDPDYAAGKAAIEAKDWDRAIRLLSSVALRNPRNADVQNYLGYAYRHTNRFEPAFEHYQRALQLDPRHRGAHEYIGEAYLLVNEPAKAEEHLAALEKICLIPCEEYDDLKKAIAAYRGRQAR